MKIYLKIILTFLLKSALAFSQDVNTDTIYIKLNGIKVINSKTYKKLTISKDSTHICGYIRKDIHNNIYYLENKKEVIIWGRSAKNTIKIENFGFFGSIKLIKKKHSLFAKRISMVHSASSILSMIEINKIQGDYILINFIYYDRFGILKKDKIIL